MTEEEIKQRADLFSSIMPWNEEEDTWEDIAERAYIAGATEATKTLSDNFDRFIELLQKLCEEVAKLKNKVVRSEKE